MAAAEKAASTPDASAEGEPKKGSKLKLILVILVALLFMVGGGGAVGVFLLGMKLPFMKQPPAEEQVDEAQKIDPKEAERREQEKRDAEKAKQKAAATRSLFVLFRPSSSTSRIAMSGATRASSSWSKLCFRNPRRRCARICPRSSTRFRSTCGR